MAGPSALEQVDAGARLASVDAFRGLTVAAMLLVNDAGDWGHVYAPLAHADWHGCTLADLVFPFFLFIVGVSIALSVGVRVDAGAAAATLRRSVCTRALRIIVLGLVLHAVLHWLVDTPTFRPLGVLQRIGICSAVVGLLAIDTRPRTQWLVCAALLLGYWALLAWGGPLTKGGNLASRVDTALLGRFAYQFDAATPGQRIAFSQFFGQHGYLPELVDLAHNVNMHATFVAAGPGIRRQATPVSGVRAIDLAPTLIAALARLPSRLKGALAFTSSEGQPIDPDNFIKRDWARALRRSNLRRIRFHDLRHTCASLLIAQGAHPKYIQVQPGHASIQTALDRYGHLMPEMHEAEARKLDRLIFGPGSDREAGSADAAQRVQNGCSEPRGASGADR